MIDNDNKRQQQDSGYVRPGKREEKKTGGVTSVRKRAGKSEKAIFL